MRPGCRPAARPAFPPGLRLDQKARLLRFDRLPLGATKHSRGLERKRPVTAFCWRHQSQGMPRFLLKLAKPMAPDRDVTLRRFAVQERVWRRDWRDVEVLALAHPRGEAWLCGEVVECRWLLLSPVQAPWAHRHQNDRNLPVLSDRIGARNRAGVGTNDGTGKPDVVEKRPIRY